MKTFQEKFCITKETLILDVGGTIFNWNLLFDQPKLVIVSINSTNKDDKNSAIPWIVADGKALPFRDRSFDIVFSNSVIEHLGAIDQ